jgi:hypothetical protein
VLVSDDFGGWALMGQFPGETGQSLEARSDAREGTLGLPGGQLVSNI